MNAPDREESVLLDETTEVKVGYKVDSKIVNSADFIFVKEDHTLGNMMRMYMRIALAKTSKSHRKLLEDATVRFAGYRHPHPLETLIEMKVRTDGSVTALDAIQNATTNLNKEIRLLEERFRDARDQYNESVGMM
ncbi:DNA-directed RNA polymerase II subunit RPB11 [Hondaea fermentalgiana]|uniref:DNA-directed RNA polymerase II subunit RPB11 n=1 Tax=Hondaea fermentalgiana TaxID=2315210 RepID=A0A2R5G0T5_9STRA|nr:DNA-directed RNA polymerase II subunit RPB11 [Hondaea fermentalgiana]|eukprot:GBG24620.1 DNA-directed RNA polymerase II subunit RPB11 [Hondaea fermentalgiana]